MKADGCVGRMSARTAIVLALLLCTQAAVFPQEEVDTIDENPLSFAGRVEVGTSYNDNILDYAPLDFGRWDSVKYASNNLKKFSVDRLSDNITAFKLRLATSAAWIENAPTSLRVRNTQYVYNANHIRNYASWDVELRQVFLKRNRFTLGYSLLPRYYLRNLWYRQRPERNPYHLFSRYVEAFLTKRGYSAEVGRNFSRRFSSEVGYEYEYTEYNREFSERNNNTHNVRLGLVFKPTRSVELIGNYRYALSWASGRDDPDSTIADVSYRSNRVAIGVNVSLRSFVGVPLRLENDFIFENQVYVSDKVPVVLVDAGGNRTSYGDKYHYGRKDTFYRVATQVIYRVSKPIDLFVQYSWEQNRSNLTETSDAGSYQTHQVGVGGSLSF